MWAVTWVMLPYFFLRLFWSLGRLSKFTRQKTTQPWWPLLRYYYYAATSNRDMAGGEHHHQQSYYAIMIDDMLLPSWLAHKTTSKMVHRSWHQNILLLYYVHRTIDKRLLWRCHLTTWPIYVYSFLGGTLLANLASPIQPKLTYIWYA